MNQTGTTPTFRASAAAGAAAAPERKAVGTPLGRTLLNIAVTLVFAAVYFYVVLPPINLKERGISISSCCWSAPCTAAAPC